MAKFCRQMNAEYQIPSTGANPLAPGRYRYVAQRRATPGSRRYALRECLSPDRMPRCRSSLLTRRCEKRRGDNVLRQRRRRRAMVLSTPECRRLSAAFTVTPKVR